MLDIRLYVPNTHSKAPLINDEMTSGDDLVSLKGPLRDKKSYIKTILEPLDVRVQSMRNRTVGDSIAYYEIIWDTPTAEPRTGEIEITLLSRFDELLFRVVPDSIESQRVVRRLTSRTTRVLFRHTANLEVSVDTSAV